MLHKKSVLAGVSLAAFWTIWTLRPAQATLIIPSNVSVASDGAVSTNYDWEQGRTDKWYIEWQRYGANYVEAGVAREDPSLINQGLKILNWGFNHQASDGSFGTSSDLFHSTSFFIEAASRSTLLLKNYHPVTYTLAPGTYDATVSSYTSKLKSAAKYMILPDVASAGQAGDAPYAHRRWIMAAALAQIGALTGDNSITRESIGYAKRGASVQKTQGWIAALNQNADGTYPPATLVAPGVGLPSGTDETLSAQGVNPELEGFDVSYQGVGVFYADNFYPLCADAGVRDMTKTAISNALYWERKRILPDGTIIVDGSSRIGLEDDRAGNAKTPAVGLIVDAFRKASQIIVDPRLNMSAERADNVNTPVSSATYNSNGAVGSNVNYDSKSTTAYNIGLQKAGADFVAAGVTRENEDLIQTGLLMLDWGWKRQEKDGSFSQSDSAFWNTAQFAEANARVALLLKNYHPLTYTPDPAFYPAKVASYTSKVRSACRWLTRSDIAEQNQNAMLNYLSHAYGLAAALGESGQLCGDSGFASAALGYINAALPLQTSAGINPANGTWDVNDQAYGIQYAEWYYPTCKDSELRAKLRSMMIAGLNWEARNVDVQGIIHNTSSPAGRSILSAYQMGYQQTGRASFNVIATRIDNATQ